MPIQVLRTGRDYPTSRRGGDDDGSALLAALMASMGQSGRDDREANIAELGLLLNRDQGEAALSQRESEFSRTLTEERDRFAASERAQGENLRLLRDQFNAGTEFSNKQFNLLQDQWGEQKQDNALLRKHMIDLERDQKVEGVVSNVAGKFQSGENRRNELLKLRADHAMRTAAQQAQRGASLIAPTLSSLGGRSQFVLNPTRTPTTEELGLFDQSTKAAINGFGNVLGMLKEGGLSVAEARGAIDTTLSQIGVIVDSSYTLPADRQKKLAPYIKPLEEMRIKLTQIGAQLPDPNEGIDTALFNEVESGVGREGQVQGILDNIREADGGSIRDLRRMASGQLAGIGDDLPTLNVPNVSEEVLTQLLAGRRDGLTPTTSTGGTVDATPESSSLFRLAARGAVPAIDSASNAVGQASGAAAPYISDTLLDLMSLGSADQGATPPTQVTPLPTTVRDPIDGTAVQRVTKADVLRWRSRGVTDDQMRAMGVPPELLN